MSAASNAATDPGYAPPGFTRSRVTGSLAIAVVLHVLVLGSYFFLGSSKKPAAAAVPAKPTTEIAGTVDSKTDPKAKADPLTENKKPSVKAETSAEKKVDPKNTDVAKPGEIPKQPDSSLDDLFKK